MAEAASSVTRAAKTLGSRGGRKGGPARARALTQGQRKRIAQLGGEAKARRKGK